MEGDHYHGDVSTDVPILNLQAVELMRLGHYGEAIGKLKQALSQVGTILHLLSWGEWTESRDDYNCVAVDETPIDLRLENDQACVDCVLPWEHPASRFHMFNRGLVLCEPVSEGCATAVLCYNLAMVYHLKALKRGNHGSYYRWALKIYDLIISMIRVASNYRDGALILLLAVNNKGHLLASLRQKDDVKACFEILCILVEDTAPWMLYGGIFSPIMLNVVLYGKKHDHAPAA